ncbi:MAG: PilZ domain-containing protein [Oligoflexia bacterium]|nr:PilZ domain-containing protein [Oligoflexia bacterium]MBF0366204.1 PilZ domain-containing protein [Oligoflexia bacterium]
MTDEVINFTKKRNESIEQRRREFERVMFQSFLGVYSVIDNSGDQTIATELVDISEKGCLFQVPCHNPKNSNLIQQLKNRNVVDLRLYFTEKSYLLVTVNIKYCKEFVDQDGVTYYRFGCEFDKNSTSFEAMESFIRFIYKFAEHASTDRGDKKGIIYL